MKVVLFCGGLGLRFRNAGYNMPKPLGAVGELPIIEHLMRYYSAQGHVEFVLCVGYGASAIKQYFLNGDIESDISDAGLEIALCRHRNSLQHWYAPSGSQAFHGAG